MIAKGENVFPVNLRWADLVEEIVARPVMLFPEEITPIVLYLAVLLKKARVVASELKTSKYDPLQKSRINCFQNSSNSSLHYPRLGFILLYLMAFTEEYNAMNQKRNKKNNFLLFGKKGDESIGWITKAILALLVLIAVGLLWSLLSGRLDDLLNQFLGWF